jgi:hypothetical protein
LKSAQAANRRDCPGSDVAGITNKVDAPFMRASQRRQAECKAGLNRPYGFLPSCSVFVTAANFHFADVKLVKQSARYNHRKIN